ncbi:MAG: calcium-binding protein, partial [Selenomonadaceae bacterium]|nr:calcium-binding protein [Selenomonadaceae bacterium]
FSNSTDSLTFSDVTTTAKVNIYHKRREVLNKGVFIAADDWYKVEDSDLTVNAGEEVYFVGPSATEKHGVDFSGISSDLNVTMDTAYIDSEDYVPGTTTWINGVYSLRGGAGNTTIIGSDKADTIIAGTGKTTINAGAGENFVNLEDAESALIQLAGNTTVEGFQTGFGEGTDTIYIDGDPAGVYFKDGVLAFSNSTDSLTMSDITTTAKVNIYHKRREMLNKGVFIAAGDWYKVEDSDLTVDAGEEVYFVGTAADPKAGVDFSDISSALNITMNTAYIDSEDYVPGTTTWINGVYSLKGGAGLTTVTGSDQSDTILAGTGKTTINAGAGDDVISLQSSAALVQYNAGDGSDSISNFNSNSTLKIAGETYTSQKSGNDLIFSVGDEKITLEGAASLSAVNVDGTSETDAIIESIGTDNYTVVGAGETGTENISLSGDELIVIEDTKAKVSITASKGNDTIYSAGKNVTVSLTGGATDLIAAGGKMTVENYNATTGAAFVTNYENILTAVDGGAIYFDKGKMSVDSAIVDFNGINSRVVNFYDASGELQKVAIASPDDSLDLSKEKSALVIGVNENSTLTSGSGDDSIFAYAGSHIDAGAGKNYIEIEERGANDDGVTIALNEGRNTITNFKAGFGDDSDKLFFDGNAAANFEFDGTNLNVRKNNNPLCGILSNVADGADFVNILAADKNSVQKVVVAQAGATVKVEDEVAALYVGDKSGVDFADYDGTLNINLGSVKADSVGGDILFGGINQVTLGSGRGNLIGSASRETLAAGTGAATINGGAGRDLLIGNTSANKDGATEFFFEAGGGRDTISNFEFLTDSNLMTADKISVDSAVTNVVLKESGDVIIQTGNDWLTLENAQGNKFKINDLVATVDKNALEFDGTTNYFLATGNKATLTVSEDVGDEAIIWLGNQRGSQFVGDFRTIDASNSTAKTELAG